MPDGSWQPDATKIDEAKAALRPYVTQQASLAGKTLPKWDSYTFQFQGQEIGGKKVIFVNAFCGRVPSHATTRIVMVFDGGPCYFRAYWDPTDKIYTDVIFNGYA